MKNNIDIKALWSKQAVPASTLSETLRNIECFKRGRLKRAILLNTVLLLTILFVLFIRVYFNPQLVSTKIGIILTILPISLVILMNLRIIPLYRNSDENCSNLDYLHNLLALKRKESFMQTTVMNVYFILLSAGIGLYMYEYTFGVSMMFGIVAYTALLLWIAFNWFFLRPGIIKKNTQKIDYLIKQIEKIQSQINGFND